MPVPPVNALRVYVLKFGADKYWLNPDSCSRLNELVEAWKCRFVTIDLAGHADTAANAPDTSNVVIRGNAGERG